MLTAGEAAAQLGVKLGTLYAYVSRGWLKSYRRKVGRQALYRRADIEALRGVIAPERGVRARSLPDASSWVTVAQPPSDGSSTGVIVAESAVSSIIEGKLAYRGYPIEELVEHASFEEVCLLLWSGERPRPEEVDHLRAGIAAARLPAPVVAALAAVGADAPPLLRLAVMMPSLAAAEHRLPARSRIDQARMIITVLPLGLAPLAHEGGVSAGGASRAAGGDAGMAARLCERALADARRRPIARRSIACSSLAPSTSSTPPPLPRASSPAPAPISTPRCWRRYARSRDRFTVAPAIASKACSPSSTRALASSRRSTPSARNIRCRPASATPFIRAAIPRAALLKRVARATAKRKGRKLFETALKFEEAVWKRARLRPNLDFYLTVCVRMVGFPRGMPAAIFAMGRAAGWIAHSLEQSADNRLIRPRMRYHGSPLRHWQ